MNSNHFGIIARGISTIWIISKDICWHIFASLDVPTKRMARTDSFFSPFWQRLRIKLFGLDLGDNRGIDPAFSKPLNLDETISNQNPSHRHWVSASGTVTSRGAQGGSAHTPTSFPNFYNTQHIEIVTFCYHYANIAYALHSFKF